MSDYRCNHCGEVVRRDSAKRWIESYCPHTGETTRLWKVTRGGAGGGEAR